MTTENGEHFEVTFGEQRIPFTLEFRDGDRLAISVHPDQSVTVTAPTGQAVQDVLPRVQRRAQWIAKQRAHFEQYQPLTPPRRFVAGETHYYLGRQYRLKLVQSDKRAVALTGAFLSVSLPDRGNVDCIRESLDRWYLDHAKRLFSRRLEVCLASARSLRVPAPPIVVRRMPKRWGSCTRTGKILLNTDLVKAPLMCIEYVIMHELCHLKVHDHSPKFYRLLLRCMPDWERRKRRLEAFIL